MAVNKIIETMGSITKVEKLETLLTVPEDIFPRKDVRVSVEEYREDDEASYFEQGVMER